MHCQLAICYLIVMFIFITPDVAASSSPDADPRKKEMVMKCCLRLKVRAWGEILFGKHAVEHGTSRAVWPENVHIFDVHGQCVCARVL